MEEWIFEEEEKPLVLLCSSCTSQNTTRDDPCIFNPQRLSLYSYAGSNDQAPFDTVIPEESLVDLGFQCYNEVLRYSVYMGKAAFGIDDPEVKLDARQKRELESDVKKLFRRLEVVALWAEVLSRIERAGRRFREWEMENQRELTWLIEVKRHELERKERRRRGGGEVPLGNVSTELM